MSEPVSSRRLFLAIAVVAAVAVALSFWLSPRLVQWRVESDQVLEAEVSGQLIAAGRSSVSWTQQDVLGPPAGKLRPDRLVIVPLSCRPAEQSPWIVMIARRLDTPSRQDLAEAVARQSGSLRGGAWGATQTMAIEGDALNGVHALMFVCAPSDAVVSENQATVLAEGTMRRALAYARKHRLAQVTVAKYRLRVGDGPDTTPAGAILAWKQSVKAAVGGLRTGDAIDVLFGLYALTPGQQRANVSDFGGAVASALADLPGPQPDPANAFRLGAFTLVGAALGAWVRRRQARVTYLVALLAFSATGAATALAAFGLAHGTTFGAPPAIAFMAAAVVMSIAGYHAEKLAAFDWRKALGEAR